MRKHHLSYNEAVRRYWDISRGREQNYRKQLQQWKRIYLEEGAEGLMKERQGKACRASGTKKGRQAQLDTTMKEFH